MKKSAVKYLIIAAVSLVMVGAVVLILLLNRPIEVPNLEGKTIGKATALLEKLDLNTETQTEYSDTVKLNIVISQDVGTGTEVKRGTLIIGCMWKMIGYTSHITLGGNFKQSKNRR